MRKTPSTPENIAPTTPSTLSELAAISGDTYAVKNELKAMGAVWDKSERIWRIASDKLAQARALVEHQALSPTAAATSGGGGIELESLTDPFEQEGDGPRYAMLSERDGDVYAAKDALKAIGASWDKTSRAWKVREERAEYARAIVAFVTGDDKEAVPEAATAKTKRGTTVKSDSVPAVDAGRSLPDPKEHSNEILPKPVAPRNKMADKAGDAKVVENLHDATEAHDAVNPAPLTGMMLGGLWRRRGAGGKVYLSGWLSDTVEIRIVSNEQRVDENDPSHQMYLIPIDPLLAPKE